METKKPRHEFARGEWNPVKRPGSLTHMAKRAGRSVHEEAEKLAHTPGSSEQAKKLRGKGIFALNAQSHKFKPRTGPKKTAHRRIRSRA